MENSLKRIISRLLNKQFRYRRRKIAYENRIKSTYVIYTAYTRLIFSYEKKCLYKYTKLHQWFKYRSKF